MLQKPIYLSKQYLATDPRTIKQIEFVYKLANGTETNILTVLEKDKETVLEPNKVTVKLY